MAVFDERRTFLEEAEAVRELESYLSGGRFGRRSVPSLARPEHVERFLRARIDRESSSQAFERSRRLVDYFDLTSAVDHFTALLDRGEEGDLHFEQSCRSVAILADQGDEAQRRFGADYLRYLATHDSLVESAEAFLDALQALPAAEEVEGVETRLETQMETLEAAAEEDEQAGAELADLDQVLNCDLPRTREAASERGEVLAIEDLTQRIDELCRIYLEWERDGDEESAWWTARELRRLARADQLAEITARLEAVLAEIEAVEDDALDEEDAVFLRVRALQALRFFGAELDTDRIRYLGLNEEGLFNVLDREAL